MRILVTGGTGEVGRSTVARLVNHGHDILVIGRRKGVSIPGAAYRRCDVTDMAGVREAARGREAIVHLAAIIMPFMAPDPQIFRVNAEGTFKVFEAAAQIGIRRVVVASSINSLGYGFGLRVPPVQYLPLDEDHPRYTTDVYSVSKVALEGIAAYYWRREGITSACLRLPGVYEVTDADAFRRRYCEQRAQYKAVLDLPPDERAARVKRIIAANDVLRAERAFERPPEERREIIARATGDEPFLRRYHFFAWLDARDAAQAVEKALTADYAGSHPLWIVDKENRVGLPAQRLAETFFPEVDCYRHPLVGTQSLISIDRARDVIGFEPQHTPDITCA